MTSDALQPDPLPASAVALPRLVVAGLSGGAGKTILTLGLLRAFAKRGLAVQPFKKGPDYIDAAWHGLAAGREASNLDPWLCGESATREILARAAGLSVPADVSVIEGNRGLFDGMDVTGSTSTAELSRLLDAPVVLVLDCSKMTRTAAALVQGCMHFEPGLRLAGVLLNQTAGPRHRALLRESIERYTDVPVLGVIPRLNPNPIPERHMGLISAREQGHVAVDAALDALAAVVAENCDLDALLTVARSAPPLRLPTPSRSTTIIPGTRPRIGYVRDAALWFYYPENLDALRQAGAELVEVSLLAEDAWPELHGLYLGGGFPETQAERLSANVAVRDRVRALSRSGLPIYAECGGMMYLCAGLKVGETEYPMAGVFEASTVLCPKPQGLGYVEVETVLDTPFFPKGTRLRGHEFHYSRCVRFDADHGPAFAMKRGVGLGKGPGGLNQDGLFRDATLAAYTHIHASGVPGWAESFVAAARRRMRGENASL